MNELAPEPRRRHIPDLGSIYRRGDRWAIEFWKDGVQHRESARTSSEQEAIAHLRKRVDELAQNRYLGPRAERVTVKHLLALVTQDYATTGNRPGVRAGPPPRGRCLFWRDRSLQVQAARGRQGEGDH